MAGADVAGKLHPKARGELNVAVVLVAIGGIQRVALENAVRSR